MMNMHNTQASNLEKNPLLIAADRESFIYIRQLKGNCLFYRRPLEPQALSFCYQREVWVLYALPQHFMLAMKLGRTVQLTGSRKIFVILIQR